MKRIVFSALLGFVLCAGCNDSASAGTESADSTLTFIHINDTYRIDAVEDGNRGGFARVATVVNELKKEGRDVYILHGGDFLYPSLESQIWNGEQMVEAFNYLDSLAPMLVVPGNHEFDPRTPGAVIDAVRASRFDWLGDNLDLNTGQKDVDDALHKAFTFSWRGKRIGVFALTLLPEDGGNVRDYAIVSGEYVEIAETVIESFNSAGVDVIFGLTHLHMADDLRIAALRRQFPNFLFIVGGHEHEPEHSAVSSTSAAVMKGASNARTIWQIDVSFGDDGAMPEMDAGMIAVDRTVEEDAAYLAISDRWHGRYSARRSRIALR